MRGAGKRVWAGHQAIYRKPVKGGSMARKKNAGTIPIVIEGWGSGTLNIIDWCDPFVRKGGSK